MSTQAAVKLHRRVVPLDDEIWTVLSLRPGDPAGFATKRADETWHVLGGPAEAELLARLFWALAFQKHERTLVLVDRPFLVPDAGDPSPIVLVNADLGTPRRHALDALHALVPLTSPSLGTVKLRTVGLDRARDGVEEPAEDRAESRAAQEWREWIDRVHGLFVYAAPAAVLRRQAVMIAELPAYLPGEFREPIIERSLRMRVMREQRFPGRPLLELTDDERSELAAAGSP